MTSLSRLRNSETPDQSPSRTVSVLPFAIPLINTKTINKDKKNYLDTFFFHSSFHSSKGIAERISQIFLDSKSRSVMSLEVFVRPMEYTGFSSSTSFSVNQVTESIWYLRSIDVWLCLTKVDVQQCACWDCHDHLPGMSTCSKVTCPIEEESSIIFLLSFPLKICRMRS